MSCRAVFYLRGNCEQLAACAADLIEYFDSHPEWPKKLNLELAGEITPEEDQLVEKTINELISRGFLNVPPCWHADAVKSQVRNLLQGIVEALK